MPQYSRRDLDVNGNVSYHTYSHFFSEVKLAQNVSDLNHLMLNEFFPAEKRRINGEKS